MCTSISLVLTTFDSGLTCASTVCVNSTLTGTPGALPSAAARSRKLRLMSFALSVLALAGSSVFPTSCLTPVQGDPPNVLNFRHVAGG